MEIWMDISLQLLTAQGWAGTRYTNLPSVAEEDQCPPREQPAFPQASGSSGGQVSGVWKSCSASAEGLAGPARIPEAVLRGRAGLGLQGAPPNHPG